MNPFEAIDNRFDKLEALITSLKPQGDVNGLPAMDIMEIDEASDFLGYKKATIYEYVSKRKIPFFKKNRKLYFSKTDLTEWIKEGRVKTFNELKEDAHSYLKGGS